MYLFYFNFVKFTKNIHKNEISYDYLTKQCEILKTKRKLSQAEEFGHNAVDVDQTDVNITSGTTAYFESSETGKEAAKHNKESVGRTYSVRPHDISLRQLHSQPSLKTLLLELLLGRKENILTMFSTKKSLNKILQIYKNEIRRQISKTTSVTNSDAMVPRLDQGGRDQQPDEAIGTKKLLKLQKYHRYLSTLTGHQMPMAARGLSVPKDQSREFMACFPDIIRDLTETEKHNDVPQATKWLSKLLQYNVPNGKKNRGLATVLAYKMLETKENLTPENVHLANIMGWCVEMFHTHQLLLNDIMEGTEIRRGVPTWHKRPDVGLSGVNDAALVQASMYSTLKKHFHAKPYYKNVLECFNEMLVKCSIGHYLEKSINRTEKPDLSQFTMENYETITKYRTAYYTFQMPVSLALLMCGIEDPEKHRQAKNILLELGEFFQIQYDFLDCFGDPAVTGKNGTDIQDGRVTWLAVVALQRASPHQKLLMEKHYASSKPEDVAIIKDLYEDLQLPHTFSVYEEDTYDLIRTQIQQVTRGLPHDLFFKLLDNIFRRNV